LNFIHEFLSINQFPSSSRAIDTSFLSLKKQHQEKLKNPIIIYSAIDTEAKFKFSVDFFSSMNQRQRIRRKAKRAKLVISSDAQQGSFNLRNSLKTSRVGVFFFP